MAQVKDYNSIKLNMKDNEKKNIIYQEIINKIEILFNIEKNIDFFSTAQLKKKILNKEKKEWEIIKNIYHFSNEINFHEVKLNNFFEFFKNKIINIIDPENKRTKYELLEKNFEKVKDEFSDLKKIFNIYFLNENEKILNIHKAHLKNYQLDNKIEWFNDNIYKWKTYKFQKCKDLEIIPINYLLSIIKEFTEIKIENLQSYHKARWCNWNNMDNLKYIKNKTKTFEIYFDKMSNNIINSKNYLDEISKNLIDVGNNIEGKKEIIFFQSVEDDISNLIEKIKNEFNNE